MFVIPDVLTNAGGVTVSYYEWMQNNKGEKWLAEEVDKKLRETMTENARAVFEKARQYKVKNRIGAYILAIGRIAEKIREQK